MTLNLTVLFLGLCASHWGHTSWKNQRFEPVTHEQFFAGGVTMARAIIQWL